MFLIRHPASSGAAERSVRLTDTAAVPGFNHRGLYQNLDLGGFFPLFGFVLQNR